MEFKSKIILVNEKEFLIQNVLILKNKVSVLGFYLKEKIVPKGSHVVEVNFSSVEELTKSLSDRSHNQ